MSFLSGHCILAMRFSPVLANYYTTQMDIEQILSEIVESLGRTQTAVEATETRYVKEAETLVPAMIQQVLAKTSSNLEGMSLLALKSNSLLSYVNHLVLIILAHLERLENDDVSIEETREKVVEASIKQRVVLEKGVKPLEKKLAYQLDKMVRAFHRMEEESAKLEEKVNNDISQGISSGVVEAGEDSESEDSDSEDEDALSYKPDTRALAAMAPSKTAKGSKSTDEPKDEKYKPPKISALAPPSAHFDDKAGPKQSNRKLQSMEEYLAESSDLPQAEASIGATIVDKGRGGVKTSKERQREKEIQRYEESNFTRLPHAATKKTFKQKMAERANTFAGEDWSMFNNKRSLKEGTSRKRKAGSAWDRVKRSKS